LLAYSCKKCAFLSIGPLSVIFRKLAGFLLNGQGYSGVVSMEIILSVVLFVFPRCVLVCGLYKPYKAARFVDDEIQMKVLPNSNRD